MTDQGQPTQWKWVKEPFERGVQRFVCLKDDGELYILAPAYSHHGDTWINVSDEHAAIVAAAPETAAERDRLKAEVEESVDVLREINATHGYVTPAGSVNCRFCDNNMVDHEGTYENVHAENCVILKARAAIAKAEASK